MSEGAAAVKKPINKLFGKVAEPFQAFGDAVVSSEQERNDRLVSQNLSQIQGLTGSATSNLGFDAETLDIGPNKILSQEASQQNEQLISLINAFNARQKEVQERLTEPGNSQTRLSLVQ